MGVPAASGCFSLLLDGIATALANTAAFQSFCGVSGATAVADAKARVYSRIIPGLLNENGEVAREELERLRPFAKIWIPDGGYVLNALAARASTKIGSPTKFVDIHLERSIPGEYDGDLEAALQQFDNLAGPVFTELYEICRANPYPAMDALTLVSPAALPDRDDIEDFGHAIACVFRAQMGVAS